MRRRFVTAAAVAVAFVCPASADTNVSIRSSEEPAVRVVGTSSAHVDRFRVRLDHGRALLSLVVSGTDATRVGTITLGMPRGAKATDLVVTIGDSRSVATFVDRAQAHQQFTSIVEGKRDPALLEYVGSAMGSDLLKLQVFPLAKGKPATVEIAIELPPTEKTSWMEQDPAQRAFVDGTQSLFAGVPIAPVVPIVWGCGGGGYYGISVDMHTIRRYVRQRLERLTGCWLRKAQFDPRLEGTAVLHFTIDGNGRVGEISVDGTLGDDDIEECLAEEVATWSFYRNTEGRTQVNYPLAFRLNR